MSNAGKTDEVRRDSDRDALLNRLASKWRRFTWRELNQLESSDELVAQIVVRYGIQEMVARREVDVLLDGRTLDVGDGLALEMTESSGTAP
jgi:hypothetical protein